MPRMALFPAISMLISLYGLAFNVVAVEQQLAVIERLLPPPAFKLIDDSVRELVSQPSNALSIGLLVSVAIALWSASASTKSVLSALNVAYDTGSSRGIVGFQAICIGDDAVRGGRRGVAIAVLVFLPTVISFIGLSAYTGGW